VQNGDQKLFMYGQDQTTVGGSGGRGSGTGFPAGSPGHDPDRSVDLEKVIFFFLDQVKRLIFIFTGCQLISQFFVTHQP